MQETFRNVLVIAYYFPPLGLSGVQRTLKFVKYLPQFGWRPTVLTVEPTGYYAHDPSLLEELGPEVRIERTGSRDVNRLFRKQGTVKLPNEWKRKTASLVSDFLFIPDNKIGWMKKALARATELFEKEKFQVVFSTAPPFTDHLIALELRERFNVPFVVDYRDPWRDEPNKSFPTPYHGWMNSKLEKRVLKRASGVIVTNRRVKELMIKRYKILEYNDVTILPQGFDPADFGPETAPPVSATPGDRGGAGPRGDGKFKIVHSGVFYGRRGPKAFLQAVAKLRAADTETFGQLEVHLVGVLQDEYKKLIRRLGLEETVKVRGYLPHLECVREIRSADVLWLALDSVTQSPGKLYEYFGARKPILATAPPGFVEQALEDAGASIVTRPDDVDAILAAIRKFAAMRRNGTLPTPNEDEVKRYDRVTLTHELSKIFSFLPE